MSDAARVVRLAAAGAALLVACAAGACARGTPEDVETESVVPVTTARARVGAIRGVVHAPGTVEPAPGAEFAVTAPGSARIAAMPKAEGEAVRRGDLLVRFDMPALAAEQAARNADVERATARLRNAEAARTRAHDLFDRGVAARKEVEDADRDLAESEAALAESRAALAASRTMASRAAVRAPFDGVVVRRLHNPGDLVEPAGDPILRVVDARRLEVHAAVSVGDLARVRAGASGRAVVATGAPAATVTVVARPASVEPGAATAAVRLAFQGVPPFTVGTPVQVDIDAEQHERTVLVPAAAVVYEGADTVVFVVGPDGKAHRRAVVPGIVTDTVVEIAHGVAADDLVITRGQNGLPDGAPVRVGT
jgi:RND family efflux transporter MFP subunit